ncbi:MAG: LytTR family DNA-binding domain-containing protein [Bacteroidales bacterium]|nr:LytTR family DNA-binding domain-containing protein [Bacteroidales bacterium]
MNCIIIDDDPLATRIISEYIAKTDFLQLLKTFDNAVSAINYIEKTKESIHIIFLDIELPEMSGIDFLDTLKKSDAQIIIISGKEKYAIKAFDYEVTDYLLKPITYARFYKAVNRALNNIENLSVSKKELNSNYEFFIKKSATLVKLNVNEICYIEALENYVTIHTNTEKHTIHFTMKGIVDKLPQKFKRVHRSYIVNIDKVLGLDENTLIVKVGDQKKLIPVGKVYRENLLKALNIIHK